MDAMYRMDISRDAGAVSMSTGSPSSSSSPTAMAAAVLLLNESKMTHVADEKITKLKQFAELVVRKEPTLLRDFVFAIVELQSESAAVVRKFLAELIEEICEAHLWLLPRLVPVLTVLFHDETAAVAKRALMSGASLFRSTLARVVVQGLGGRELDRTLSEGWLWLVHLKNEAASIAIQPVKDGVRLQAIKFIETIILLYTYDATAPAKPPQQPGINEELRAKGGSEAVIPQWWTNSATEGLGP